MVGTVKTVADILRQNLRKTSFSTFKRNFFGSIVIFNKQPEQTQATFTQNVNLEVPGLSTAVHTCEEPVGPGASKTGEYKVPEYFNYNKNSYFEAEVEMHKYRCEQPSALKK